MSDVSGPGGSTGGGTDQTGVTTFIPGSPRVGNTADGEGGEHWTSGELPGGDRQTSGTGTATGGTGGTGGGVSTGGTGGTAVASGGGTGGSAGAGGAQSDGGYESGGGSGGGSGGSGGGSG